MKNNLEIERKYIIKMPDLSTLAEKSDRIINITQTYIGQTTDGFNGRIRKTTENGITKYIFTEKKRVSDFTRIENEREISFEEYEKAYKNRLKDRNVIEKTRYCVNQNGFVYEIDVFSFWQKIAFLEVELENENINPQIPAFLSLISEVTNKKGFSNFALSRLIPDENKLIKGEF